MFVFNITQTVKVIWRQAKSYPADWRSQGFNKILLGIRRVVHQSGS